jgi:predicted ferric reductase
MQGKDYIFWFKEKIGWILIVLFSIIPVVLLFATNDVGELFYDVPETLKTFGKITALVGFVLYAINLLLAVRKQWLENFFNGLNRVYIAHHITGGIALSFLLFHPLLLAAQYVNFSSLSSLRYAADYLLPDTFNSMDELAAIQEVVAFDSGIIALIGMVVLLVLTFFVKLPYRLWLFTHRFLGVAFLFAGFHVLFINSDVADSLVLTIYMASWTAIGLGAFIYRSLLGNIVIRRSRYEVKGAALLEKDVIGMYLEPIGRAVNYVSGQFVYIRFKGCEKDGISDETHPFSIAANPGAKGIVLYVKALGDYTSALKNLQSGSIAEIEGAFGKFSYTNFGDSPQIWIAGGIGITPFIGMARDLTERAPAVDLYYSVQTRRELIEQEVLSQYMPAVHPNFRYFPYVFEETNEFLSASFIHEQSGDFLGKEIFICGPPAMMKSMRLQLRRMGVKNSKIHTEEFSMS